MLALATLITWQALTSAGVLPNVEKLVGELVGKPEYRFDGAVVMRSTLLTLTSFALTATSLSIIAAAFYNLMAPVVGGIEIEICELQAPRPTASPADVDGQQSVGHSKNGHADDVIVLKS